MYLDTTLTIERMIPTGTIPLIIAFFWIFYRTSFLDLRLLSTTRVFSIISLASNPLLLMTYYWLCIALLNWGSNVFVECSIVQIALLFVMPPVCWAAKHTNEVWNILLELRNEQQIFWLIVSLRQSHKCSILLLMVCCIQTELFPHEIQY